MSKRVQVVLSDEDYASLASAARTRGTSMSQLVRESLRRTVAEDAEADAERRIAAVLRFSRFTGPSTDIDQVLAEIERGRGLS